MKLKNLKVECKKGKWVCIFFTFRGRTQSNAYIICQEEMSFQDETKWKWSILHYTAIYRRKSDLKSFFMALFLNGQNSFFFLGTELCMYIFQSKVYHNFQQNLQLILELALCTICNMVLQHQKSIYAEKLTPTFSSICMVH